MLHVITLLIAGCPQDTPAEVDAHSSHGAVFDVGPRQAAVLLDNPDRVEFSVTLSPGKEHLQPFVEQGIGQLHGFWYLEAERTFRHILSEDPDCTMAYWGLAMANVEQASRARWFARAAWLQRGLVTKRERMYIDMIARFWSVDGPTEPKGLVEPRNPAPGEEDFEEEREKRDPFKPSKAAAARLIKDYEELIWENPDDLEAKAFLVNRIWLNRRLGQRTTSRLAVEALIDDVLEHEPLHPIHHYRIHLWDAKDSAERVVDSARQCGLSWPNIAHNWHMGGHIFDKLGRYFEASWQQEASARVDHAYMQRFWVLPDEIHNFSHNNEWLIRTLRHQGRASEAIELAKNMIELPRHPSYNGVEKRRTSAWFGRQRLIQVLADFEQWEELLRLGDTMYLERTEGDPSGASRAFALGRAAAHVGDVERFDAALAELQHLEECLLAERSEAVNDAEAKAIADDAKRDEVQEAMVKALEESSGDLRRLRSHVASLTALRALIDGEEAGDALATLREHNYPRRELARLVAEYAERENDSKLREKSIDLAESEAKSRPTRVLEQATLAWTQWQAGDREAALETFEALREHAALTDTTQPPIARLAPIAAAAGYEGDWRPEAPDRAKLPLPSLDGLGPRHWSPPVAHAWTLPDAFGDEHSLSDWSGRPVLVVNFLGFGCVHCVEQLRELAPMARAFREAGIDIVAIGTQEPESLAESLGGDNNESGFEFPILCDPTMEQFRAYRAYDDFEDMALHGTYLIDGAGRVRWHDVSHLPFMDIEFLLEESQRLLGLPVRGSDESVVALTPLEQQVPQEFEGDAVAEESVPVQAQEESLPANTVSLLLDTAPHCQACIADIRRIGAKLDGFVEVTAQPNEARIHITFDSTPPGGGRCTEHVCGRGPTRRDFRYRVRQDFVISRRLTARRGRPLRGPRGPRRGPPPGEPLAVAR